MSTQIPDSRSPKQFPVDGEAQPESSAKNDPDQILDDYSASANDSAKLSGSENTQSMAHSSTGSGAHSTAAVGWLEVLVARALDARYLVILVTLFSLLFGAWAFQNLHIDAVPDISNVQVSVTANARGLAPLEIEQYITFPVELALQSMPRLHTLRSISKYGLSQVTAVFDDGTDIYWARQQVSERMKGAQESMPAGADVNLFLGPIATGLGEVYQFEVRGPGYTSMQLREILDWQIIPALKVVQGIDEVQSMGGDVKEYQVWMHPEKLHGYHISPQEVMQSLKENNANAGGGYTVENANQIALRAEGLLQTTDDIANIVIKRTQTGIIRIKDVAEVHIARALPASIATQNGQAETVLATILMRKGENSREIVTRIQKRMGEIAKSLPPNVQMITFYDRGTLIDRTIETVWHNLLEGAGLVVVVLFVLLGNWRAGLIAALAIPLSLLGAVTFLTMSNTSGNLLSLGALDFGILIDGSVVMVDNILRRLSLLKDPSKKLETIKLASQEVARPVLFAVLIIAVVYMPILFLPGVSGKTFQPMALTVIFGLLTALVLALFFTPALSSIILGSKVSEKDSFVMGLVRPVYEPLLNISLKVPLLTAGIAVIAFASSLLLLRSLGTEFIPVLREGAMVLTVDRPVSGSFDTAAKQTLLIEKLLKENPDVETVVSRTGHSEQAFDPMGPDETDVFVIFKPQSEWKTATTQEQLEREIGQLLERNVPGAAIALSQPIEQRMNELVAGAKGDVAVRIFGPDLLKLKQLGGEVAQILSHVPGASDIKMEKTTGLPLVTAKLNRQALGAYGVSGQDALDTVSCAVGGKVVGTIYQGKPRFNLVVRFAPEDIPTASELGALPVVMSSGELVPLSQITTIAQTEGPAEIMHMHGDRIYTVQCNVRDRDLGGFVEAAQKAIDKELVTPPGYRIAWGGQFENLKVAAEKLSFLVPIALCLIGMFLYLTFGAFRPVLLVFFNIPLALSGGLVALWMRGMELSVTAGVGFIALFGVAVLNGVVLVSTIEHLEQNENMSPLEAAREGARQRLRPVLMTALVASLGFLPMALATSVGAEVQRPLATVVIGGLITSTLLTLLVLPALYPIVCGNRK
ncbi:MAG TPA: CusA/CzcA family heavy metal efflux RND transporter [Oculatellaceae cyanobacterium]